MTDYIANENLRDKFPQKLDSNIDLTGNSLSLSLSLSPRELEFHSLLELHA